MDEMSSFIRSFCDGANFFKRAFPYSNAGEEGEIVLEFVPETVNRVAREYSKMSQHTPLIFVRLYTYQTPEIIELSKQIKEKLEETDAFGQTGSKIQALQVADELRTKRAELLVPIVFTHHCQQLSCHCQCMESQTRARQMHLRQQLGLGLCSLAICKLQPLYGSLPPESTKKAIEAGISGIIISNHGGRQLDYSPAPISVLEEIVKTVSGTIHVLLDGGIRRGTDVFKALALGANAVLVGQPVIFGLAANREKRVHKVIQMLNDEHELTMALTGCSTIKHISRSCVQTVEDKLRSSM